MKHQSEDGLFCLVTGRAPAVDCRVCRVGARLAGAGAGIVQQGRGSVCAGSRIIPAVLSAGAVGNASFPGWLWQLFNVLISGRIILLVLGD